MKYLAITLSVQDPAPGYKSLEEIVEEMDLTLPRGTSVEYVVELSESLYSVLTRTRGPNLKHLLIRTLPRRAVGTR